MAKSFFSGTEEWSGPVPTGGYKCVVEEIERGVTGENARTPGAKKYTARVRIVEPKRHAGAAIFDTFTIGSEEDPKAREQQTWDNSFGAKKLFRLLKRAGVPARDGDDEDWMDAAKGQEVCAHVLREVGMNGGFRNTINGEYFRESDDDFWGVGEHPEAKADGRPGGPRSARGARDEAPRAAAKRAAPVEDDDDDAPPARTAKPKEDDDEGEAVSARASKGKAAKGGRKLPEKDDDEDDDEE